VQHKQHEAPQYSFSEAVANGITRRFRNDMPLATAQKFVAEITQSELSVNGKQTTPSARIATAKH